MNKYNIILFIIVIPMRIGGWLQALAGYTIFIQCISMPCLPPFNYVRSIADHSFVTYSRLWLHYWVVWNRREYVSSVLKCPLWHGFTHDWWWDVIIHLTRVYYVCMGVGSLVIIIIMHCEFAIKTKCNHFYLA